MVYRLSAKSVWSNRDRITSSRPIRCSGQSRNDRQMLSRVTYRTVDENTFWRYVGVDQTGGIMEESEALAQL